ncbi:MAG: potassium/hydrogen antiporter [Frankiales bacterium]|nr:potassium/hydrogen antiporter [Frankiales bacterium]
MHDATTFGWIVLAYAAVGLAAVLSNRLSERLSLPTPALFLAAAAITAEFAPSLHHLPQQTVQRLVTVALVVILFDGGLHLGLRRVRGAAAPILLAGVPGTFVTAVAAGVIAHEAFGWSWWVSLLLGTAIAPTDPAVVFSVLGKREVEGRSGTILEGESGANDPVGIALMAGLLGAGGISLGALGETAGEFALQMLVGAAVGILGGQALLAFMRRVSLPSEGLYPLRTLAGAMTLFGLASVLHGSGFLAVFLAGILLGDAQAPYKKEVERFHSALASLGEIVAFIVLGLTVDLPTLGHSNVLVPGLVLAAALTFAIRPLAITLCLAAVGLSGKERSFVLWAGLKGAVPILLGSYLLSAPVPEPQRLYGVVVIVVAFSVVVQGGLVPFVAGRLKIPMRAVEPEPWSLGVRLQDQPDGVQRFTVEAGSVVDGRTVGDLDGLWVGIVIRDGALLSVRKDTRLAAGDDVLVVAGAEAEDLAAAFAAPDGGVPGRQAGTTPPMDSPPRSAITAADLEAAKERLRSLAEEVALTEDRIADTFEHLAATGGDPDGRRRRIADEARRAAEAERRKARGSDPTSQDV